MKIEIIKIEELKHFKENPRKISKEELENLKKSIQKFGMVDPLIIDGNNIVIGGNQRLVAAKEMSLKDIPCVRVLNLTDNEKKALNLALNKISGDWDEDKLTKLLREINEQEKDILEFIGFDEAELDDILEREPVVVEEDLEKDKGKVRMSFEIPSDVCERFSVLLGVYGYDKDAVFLRWLEKYLNENEK